MRLEIVDKKEERPAASPGVPAQHRVAHVFSLTPAEVIDALVAAGLFARAVSMVVLGFILQSDQPAVTDETAALS